MDKTSHEEQAALWDEVWTQLEGSLCRRICLFTILIARWIRGHVDLEDLDVVEVGGVGHLPRLLSPNVRSVTCFDYSGNALDVARKVCRGMPNVRFVQGDLFEQEEAAYDLAVSIGLIEHYFGDRRVLCMKQHARMSRRYVVVGAPSDLPHNWWRSVANNAAGKFPAQTPISERELHDLMVAADVEPIAMTRIDPDYGRRRSPIRLLWRVAMRLGIGRGSAIDRPDGGILVGLGRRVGADGPSED